jgi:sialate O-acetylesterase
MAVSSDKGDPVDVHPRDKKPIGERLARIALYYDYDFKHIVPEGPAVQYAKESSGLVNICFENGDGMHTSDGKELRGFELADESDIFYAVDKVSIEGNVIKLSSERVKTPVKVRYAWQPYTTANLVNGEELPASTFVIEISK